MLDGSAGVMVHNLCDIKISRHQSFTAQSIAVIAMFIDTSCFLWCARQCSKASSETLDGRILITSMTTFIF